MGRRRLDATAGISSPYNTDPEPWRLATLFDLTTSGDRIFGWAWDYASAVAGEGIWHYGGRGLDGIRWWWDTAINYSDLTGTRYGVVRAWMLDMHSGQTFNYDFDLVARDETGAWHFTQRYTTKTVGPIEIVNTAMGRYEAYRVERVYARESWTGLLTFVATTEYWRPDMGLLKSIETARKTFDFEHYDIITLEANILSQHYE